MCFCCGLLLFNIRRGEKVPGCRSRQLQHGSPKLCEGFKPSVSVLQISVCCFFWEAWDVVVQAARLSAILPHKQNDTDGLSKHACLRFWKRLLFRIVLLHRQRQGSMMNFENLIKVAKRC